MLPEDWELLGTEPTTDLRMLKRAYARALREHPPERDPHGFMRINAAFERLRSHLEEVERRKAAASDPESPDPQPCSEKASEPAAAPDAPDGSSTEGEPVQGQDEGSGPWRRFGGWDQEWSPGTPLPDSTGDEPSGRGLPTGDRNWRRFGGWGPGWETPEPTGEAGSTSSSWAESSDEASSTGGSWSASPSLRNEGQESGDPEVGAVWIRFRHLWEEIRWEPGHEAWTEFLAILREDGIWREQFARRLEAFFGSFWIEGRQPEAHGALLWALAVLSRWDRDRLRLGKTHGDLASRVLEKWREAAAVHHLLVRMDRLRREIGWVDHSAWEQFRATMQMDRRIHRAFSRAAVPVLDRYLVEGGDHSGQAQVRHHLLEPWQMLEPLPGEEPDPPPAPPPTPGPHVEGVAVVSHLQATDRQVVVVILGLGLALVGLLVALVWMRLKGIL